MRYSIVAMLMLTANMLAGSAIMFTASTASAASLVLAAPRHDNSYYASKYQSILEFQVNYAKVISRRDKVVILADDAAYAYFSRHLPKSMLLRQPVDDIWVRDFSPIAHKSGIQFSYSSKAGGGRAGANAIQASFDRAVGNVGVTLRKSKYILDGGNFVGYGNKAIVSDRFLRDNRLSKKKAKEVLKQLLGVSQVAIIANDDPGGLAHADGMVMFADGKTLFINQYKEPFRTRVLKELRSVFPKVKIVEIPVRWSNRAFDPAFGSACGIYVNAVVTNSTIYLPQFGIDLDKTVLNLVRKHTAKRVVPVQSASVCAMGGSARCLVWQAGKSHANRLLRQARKN